jgi:hypothetical protein
MTATADRYRTPYVSQMLAEPDRTYDDCAASTGIMLFNDWTLGEWSIRPDGKQRDLLLLRNTVRKRIGDTDGGLTLHDVNDIGHELDPDLPDLPRYNGQAAKPGQSTAGATLRLDRWDLKALLMNGHSAAICGISGTVGHVVHVTDGTAAGVLRKDPLTRKGENWAGDRITWSQLWAFTEAERNGERAYGSPDAIACAVVKVGEQTEASRVERKAGLGITKLRTKLDAQKAQTTLATEERNQARRELAASQQAYQSAMDALAAANKALDECQARPTDCSEETDRALMAESKLADIRAALDR